MSTADAMEWVKVGVIVGLVLFFVVPFLSTTWLLIWIERRKTKAIEESLRDLMSQRAEFFRVRYSSKRTFRRRLKFFPWDASGVLVIEGGGVVFHTQWARDRDIELPIRGQRTARAKFIRNGGLWNSGLSFVEIRDSGQFHYLTAETGFFRWRNSARTLELANRLQRLAAIPSAVPGPPCVRSP